MNFAQIVHTLLRNQSMQNLHIDEVIQQLNEYLNKCRSRCYKPKWNPKLDGWHIFKSQVVFLEPPYLSNHCHLYQSLLLQPSFATMREGWSGAHKDQQKPPTFLHYEGSNGSRNFFQVFLKKNKLHNLIKRKFYILTTTIIKKTHKYIKFYSIKFVEFSCDCC